HLGNLFGESTLLSVLQVAILPQLMDGSLHLLALPLLDLGSGLLAFIEDIGQLVLDLVCLSNSLLVSGGCLLEVHLLLGTLPVIQDALLQQLTGLDSELL